MNELTYHILNFIKLIRNQLDKTYTYTYIYLLIIFLSYLLKWQKRISRKMIFWHFLIKGLPNLIIQRSIKASKMSSKH